MREIMPAYQRDVIGITALLLEHGKVGTAKMFQAMPESDQLLLLGAVHGHSEWVKTFGHGQHCVLKQLRIALGATCEDLARLISQHWHATRRAMQLAKQSEMTAKWESSLTAIQQKRFKAGQLQPPEVKPLETLAVTAASIRHHELHRKPREVGGDKVALPYETFFQCGWDSLMSFNVPERGKALEYLDASVLGDMLRQHRAELERIAVQQLGQEPVAGVPREGDCAGLTGQKGSDCGRNGDGSGIASAVPEALPRGKKAVAAA